MLVKMKKYELDAVENCKRFTSNWDYFSLAADSYMSAYRQARLDVDKEQKDNILFDAKQAGEDLVEVEITDGKHQLTIATFNKWKKENATLSLKEAMTTYLKMFNIHDIRVLETNEVISFQGTCTRKQEFTSSVNVQD